MKDPGSYINSGCIGINLTEIRTRRRALPLQLIAVGKRHCRVLYIYSGAVGIDTGFIAVLRCEINLKSCIYNP